MSFISWTLFITGTAKYLPVCLFVGVGTGSSERGLNVSWSVAEWCVQEKGVKCLSFCLFLFATTELGSDLRLLKQNTGRFKATFCDQQTAHLQDRDSMKMQSPAYLEGPFYLL